MNLFPGAVADQGFGSVLFVGTFESGSQVHSIADNRVVESQVRAEVADSDGIRIDPDPDPDRRQSSGSPLLSEFLQPLGHANGGAAGL